jgi:hypothetical protein
MRADRRGPPACPSDQIAGFPSGRRAQYSFAWTPGMVHLGRVPALSTDSCSTWSGMHASKDGYR